jgi:hypothetical protein
VEEEIGKTRQQSALTSTSMQRQPDNKPSHAVRGSSRNFPFVFGGIESETLFESDERDGVDDVHVECTSLEII